MKVQDIYNLAIKKAIQNDLRGEEAVKKELKRRKEKFEKLSKKEKEAFDRESLTNPYLDSRILNLSQDKEIKKVLVGIDIEPAEILMAKEVGGIDLIISHHPLGKGLANLEKVMALQSDVLNRYGVPINIAEGLMKKRISEVARGVNALNHQRTVDTAKILGFNLACFHTVCDNLVASFLKRRIDEENFERVGELLNFLKEIPEYKKASKFNAGPKIFVGNKENRCGKIAVTEVTGGAEGSPELYKEMATAGIGTIVGMHISEKHKEKAEKSHLNIVIAGHMSSDSLGVNLFIDELEKRGIEIVSCSGFIRVSRNG
jgi:putative NIF3 family GTP cyclohydrolase 1 type 2